MAEPKTIDEQTATAEPRTNRAQPLRAHAVPPERYTVQEALGEGAVGIVVAALDGETRRVVALKLPKRVGAGANDATMSSGEQSHAGMQRFLAEARLTAQLEHPAVVPVYDLGRAADGTPYYAMRRVSSRSLKHILTEPDGRKRWTTARLVPVLLQVARALAYAHSRGVVHRDVKPANVLIGDYGEVYLADWGLARVTRQGGVTPIEHDAAASASASALVGTPGYIAPEVIRGEADTVDHRVDLFALGVMLYQVLTGTHPFRRQDAAETVVATYEIEPPRPSSLVRECPLLLDDLCVALLAKDPSARPQSADDAARVLEDFLEGAKEKERRATEARRLCAEAAEPLRRLAELDDLRAKLTAEARARARDLNRWDPVEKKADVWELEDRAARAENDAARALAHAIDLHTKALGYDADCSDAHRGLADIYFAQAQMADRERRVAARIHYEALLADHDDGRYGALLRADATLTLHTHPVPARVTARPWVERRRVLSPGDPIDLGTTPIDRAKLPAGSWLLTLDAPGFRSVRQSILLRRGADVEATVNLYTDEEIGDGFIYVPGGVATLGGDPDAYDSRPLVEVHVGDFAIARFPVTFREYCAWLDALSDDEARRRMPHDNAGAGSGTVVERVDGRWTPSDAIIEGDARKMFPASEGHLWNVPVCLVDWFDARAYSRAKGARLATEDEWEKAARGVDSRFYPWGDRFDATFCKMRYSRPFTQQPEPNGTFAVDESPYGVRDMAGGMREWVGDVSGRRSAAELDAEVEPSAGTERGHSTWREIRSGNWSSDASWARSASRGGSYALTRGGGLGFRLAKSLSRRALDPP